jgi:hypothetical protein
VLFAIIMGFTILTLRSSQSAVFYEAQAR